MLYTNKSSLGISCFINSTTYIIVWLKIKHWFSHILLATVRAMIEIKNSPNSVVDFIKEVQKYVNVPLKTGMT